LVLGCPPVQAFDILFPLAFRPAVVVASADLGLHKPAEYTPSPFVRRMGSEILQVIQRGFNTVPIE
jgi:hypothetical protein